jgi:uncharacterized protein
MRYRVTAAAFGVAFGFMLAWAGLGDPDAIRRMLLLEEAYLYLVFFSAVGVAFAGLRALRWRRARAFLTRERITWSTGRPEARHIVGSAAFGVGWAVSSSCPGPIATQLGQGLLWSLFTIAGIAFGVALRIRQTDASSSTSAAVAAAAEGS